MGSPNYVKTGDYTLSAQDLQIPTRSLPLAFSRSYRRSRTVDGSLGLGWTSNLNMHLTYATYQYSSSTFYKEAVVLMADGMSWRFRENADGTFTSQSEADTTLLRKADGSYDLTPVLSRAKYHFDSSGSLLSMTDDYGNTLNWVYDGNGRLQQVADATGSGRYLNVYYGADGRMSAVQDHTSRSVQFNYTNGTLNSVVDPAGRSTYYVYSTGRFGPVLTQIKDNWSRVISDITYDQYDRTNTYTQEGETWTYTYETGPNETTKKDSSNYEWKFTYDSSGRITNRLIAGTVSTSRSFTSEGLTQQDTDGRGIKTYYTYNSDTSVATITRDYQGTQAVRFDYAYDSNFPGKVTEITPKNPSTGAVNPDWQASRYDYYQSGSTAPGALYHVYRVESDGSTLDTLATYTYNAAGQVLTVTDATSGVTSYSYDSNTGDLLSVTYPKNSTSGSNPVYQYSRDTLGRVTSVTDPLNHATSYTYDNLDRIVTVTLPKPSSSSTLNFTTTYSYDNYDSPSTLVFTNQTDPNSKLTKQGYDQFGHLAKSIDAQNNNTTFTYAKGFLTSITDANNNTTSYTYDGRRWLNVTTFPDGTTENNSFNGDGTLDHYTNRSGTNIAWSYDHLKRITQKNQPYTEIFTYTGQKLTTVSYSENHTMIYDSSYRVSSVTQDTRGTVSYTYDAADRIATAAVTGGPTATYGYYNDGSMKTIGWTPVSGQFLYTYTLNGQYGTITFPNSQYRDYTYDDQGRLTQIANIHPTPGNLATYSYGYDVDNYSGNSVMLGQRSSLSATVPGQSFSNSLTKYYYDANYQLTQTDYPNVAPFNAEVDSWTYDAIGNRLTNTVNGTTQTYAYFKNGSNQLNGQKISSDSVNTYTYDNRGDTKTQVTPGGTYTFNWGNAQQITSISGLLTASYVYDYLNRRDSKTVSGSTTTYLYDGQNLIKEMGASAADYLFGPGIDEPLAMVRSSTPYYFDVDGLGSVTLVNDASGTVRNNYVLDAWGNSKSQTVSVANPFTYTAREAAEAGLMYYRARYYSSSTGRFVSEDPKASPDQDVAQIYAYVVNSPTMATDPLGLFSVDKSCDCYPYNAGPGNSGPPTAGPGNFSGRLQLVVSTACQGLGAQINDPALKKCIKKSCEKGNIKCNKACDSKTRWGQGGSNKRSLGPIKIPDRTAEFCPENFGGGGGPPTDCQLGQVALHEWAHGCFWEHPQLGTGLWNPEKGEPGPCK
jgi:RHS repeat-associated protein